MDDQRGAYEDADGTSSPQHSPIDTSTPPQQSKIEMKNSEQLKAVHQMYRKMESNRRHHHIDTEGRMRRQQALLENLHSDNHALQEMVDTYVIKDYQQHMARLLEEANKYSSLVEIETKKLNELESAISKLSSKELECKRAMGGYKAGWTKHHTTQIHIQQTENRLQKASVDLNVVQGHNKTLKDRMAQLQQEQAFYDSLYRKLDRELQAKQNDIQNCIENISQMYEERNEFQEAASDLHEMSENQRNYFQWHVTEGWSTQEPIPLSQIGTDYQIDSEIDTSGAGHLKHDQHNMVEQDPGVVKILTKTHRAKRKNSAVDYRQWVEIKAFSNIQDLLKVGDISGVLPALLEGRNKNSELFSDVTHLIKEMDDLDTAMQENILNTPISEEADLKTSFPTKRHDLDETIESLIDILRHLEIDDDTFLPVVTEMKRKIVLIFKEAGCDIKDEELGLKGELLDGKQKAQSSESVPVELTIGKFFNKLEDFVDTTSGTLT